MTGSGRSGAMSKHFTEIDRENVQKYISKGLSCAEMALRLGKDPTSVSREIKRNRVSDGHAHGKGKPSLRCANFSSCEREGLCGGCAGFRCRTRMGCDCTTKCPDFAEERCPRTARFPHVCNGCDEYRRCRFERFTYTSKVAQAKADVAASEPRRGIDLTGAQLAELDSLLTPLMLKGQSLNQIYMAHADEVPCTLRSLYTHVNRGEVGAGRMGMIDAVRRKPRKRAAPARGGRVPRASLEGRSWEDYLELSEDEREARWEMDTVLGCAGGSRACLLTLLHRRTRLQLALLLDSCTQDAVAAALDALSGLPSSPFAPGAGAVVLTDNGSEFFGAEAVEAGGRARLFYCESCKSWQKGAAEKNHVYYRRIWPKGADSAVLDRGKAALMASHVNSTPRAVLGGISPIEAYAPNDRGGFLDALGVELVARDDVVLKPSLIGLGGDSGDNER